MKLQSAANMHANRRKLLITDKTRLSFHQAMLRMWAADAMAKAKAKAKCQAQGHTFMGQIKCRVCGEVNPGAIILVTPTDSAIITNIKTEAA